MRCLDCHRQLPPSDFEAHREMCGDKQDWRALKALRIALDRLLVAPPVPRVESKSYAQGYTWELAGGTS